MHQRARNVYRYSLSTTCRQTFQTGVVMRICILGVVGLALLSGSAFAVGSDDTEPPSPTPTSESCPDGKIWIEKTKKCLDAGSSSLNDEQRYIAVRKLAYAGRLSAAKSIIAHMSPNSDAAWAYRGFIARKEGNWILALENYKKALALNPNNILARSYFGQGLVLRGEIALAEEQLAEIRARGGAGTWAETSLMKALASGGTTDY